MRVIADKWIFILIGIVSIFIVGAAVFSLSGSEKSGQVSKGELVKDDSHVLGVKDAKVTIVEFSDFQCPACQAAHPIVKKVITEYGDRILFVYRHFPIISSHKYALKAAEAAEAAGEQGKFWQYFELVFSSGGKLTIDDLKKYAKELNLDMNKFESDLNSDKYKNKVMADLADGEKLGVDSTPTFFINGKKYVGVQSYDQFKNIIESELKSSK